MYIVFYMYWGLDVCKRSSKSCKVLSIRDVRWFCICKLGEICSFKGFYDAICCFYNSKNEVKLLSFRFLYVNVDYCILLYMHLFYYEYWFINMYLHFTSRLQSQIYGYENRNSMVIMFVNLNLCFGFVNTNKC